MKTDTQRGEAAVIDAQSLFPTQVTVTKPGRTHALELPAEGEVAEGHSAISVMNTISGSKALNTNIPELVIRNWGLALRLLLWSAFLSSVSLSHCFRTENWQIVKMALGVLVTGHLAVDIYRAGGLKKRAATLVVFIVMCAAAYPLALLGDALLVRRVRNSLGAYLALINRTAVQLRNTGEPEVFLREPMNGVRLIKISHLPNDAIEGCVVVAPVDRRVVVYAPSGPREPTGSEYGREPLTAEWYWSYGCL